MGSSDVARFLRKQFLESLAKEDNSGSSSDHILASLKKIGKKMEANSAASTNHEFIPCLQDLNDALNEWRIPNKGQNKSIKKRIFSCHDHEAHVDEGSVSSCTRLLSKIKTEASSSSAELSQPKLQLLDGYTFFIPHGITSIENEVPHELEKRMVDWLLTSGDEFKAVGICGMGGSGKTAFVKNVLRQKTVGDKFKRIIWACLSDLTSEEIDVSIVEYLLYCLGLDTDSLVGDINENKNWLMEEVERRLKKSRNYILVLDDMWHCSNWFADDLLGRLKKTGGGAVIVTSRRKTVAEKICENNWIIHLNPSDYKESAFFETKAVP